MGDVREEIRVYEDKQEPQYCPVRLLDLYGSKRPAEMCQPTSRFYLQPQHFKRTSAGVKSEAWYKKQVNI